MTRRIALISEHASPAALLGGEDSGGQNVYVDEISRALARIGCRVDVFTRRESETEPDLREWAPGVRIVNVPVGPPRHVPKDELWPLMPAFRDWMHDFATRTATRYDLIHGNFWMSGWVACELKRRWGVPAVQLFHALGTTKRLHQGAADTSPPERIAVERRIVAAADTVIASCPAEAEQLVAEYGACPDRIATIPLGVDTALFRPIEQRAARQRIGIAPAGPVITYVGRILPRKDVRNVVRALALLPDQACCLLIVGGETVEPDPVATPELGELRALADQLGLGDRVLLAGKRPREELRDWYGAGDVAVTTPWYEPFGLTPLEAMACGRPVIGSEVGGIAYTVQHGQTGLLVPPRNPHALADAFTQLLSNHDHRRQIGRNARQRVERHFTWPTVAERTAIVYEQLIEASRTEGEQASSWLKAAG